MAGSPGGDRRDRLQVQTGTQWVHLPEKYGKRRGVYNRLRMWALDGTWQRVFTTLMAQADADEDLAWAVPVDSTVVRAHQHAAGRRTLTCDGPGIRRVRRPASGLLAHAPGVGGLAAHLYQRKP
ncbi:transposase [Streptomyces sp. NPDC058202]|uniref:transposase n=1 Tax=Streptomyces sp. NPDC058202 TaxID=3346380 RepID=UPI0036E1606A